MPRALYFVHSIKAIEHKAQNRLPGRTLMQRAGFAAARFIIQALSTLSSPARILILAGPGNNGGDGFEVALHLKLAGHDVQIAFCGGALHLPEDAQGALSGWKAIEGAVSSEWPNSLNNWDVIVDALFGIGLTRPITGVPADWIYRANKQKALRIAIDIPSGLAADTGTIVGGDEGVVFLADHTITFIGDKPGLHTLEGVDAAGHVTVDNLQIDTISETDPDGSLNEPDQFLRMLPIRKKHSHKGQFGNLIVVGGNQSMAGAALLSARAGLHSGAGKVYVVPLDASIPRLDFIQPELMFRSISDLKQLSASAIVVGPGMGMDALAEEVLVTVLNKQVPTLIDADGLNLVASRDQFSVQLKQHRFQLILTPHPLEAARLLKTTTQAVQADRIQAALSIARTYNAIVVLKGAGSIIARPEGYWVVNPTGCPALSSAGTGDVLSGLIGSLLAQGMPAWEATLAGVWLHGRASESLASKLNGYIGVTASELILASRKELNVLRMS